jgi:hypothetical protein
VANSSECRRMRYDWLRRARGSSGDSYAHQEAFCMLGEVDGWRRQAHDHGFRRATLTGNELIRLTGSSPARFLRRGWSTRQGGAAGPLHGRGGDRNSGIWRNSSEHLWFGGENRED